MRTRMCLFSTLAALAALVVLSPVTGAEQASSGALMREAGLLDAGMEHVCAVLSGGALRCWGAGGSGRLGYGNVLTIGDTELPSSAGPVDVGAGRTVRAVAAGGGLITQGHTCAILDDGHVRCWGNNARGQLGLGNPLLGNVGDDEAPGGMPTVDLGGSGKAVGIAAGHTHACAIRDDGNVLCWGDAGQGQLGYGNQKVIGDDEKPSAAGTVDLGAGRTARAIAAGDNYTCAILDDRSVRCWGAGVHGQLGDARIVNIGDNEKPTAIPPVNLGPGRTAVAIAAGLDHTCAILDNGSVRCWGIDEAGELGYGNTTQIGDDETPDKAGPVDLGAGRTAVAIAAGGKTTCAILDDGSVRCWGLNDSGQLGYGNKASIGDNETPAAAGPVKLGAGRTARAITVGDRFVCALLDDGTVRCWGLATSGQLGTGTMTTIGDDETPDSAPLAGLGGVSITAVGDASVGLVADNAMRTVGQQVQLTATLSSAGPATLPGAVVTVTLPPGLMLLSATPSAGSFAGSVWSLPALGAGQTATLTIAARVTAPGSQTATAELTATAPFFTDIDSTPGNHVAGEDDQASVTIAAIRAPVIAPAAAPVLSAVTLQRGAVRFMLSEPAIVAIAVDRVLRARTARASRYVRVAVVRRRLGTGRHKIALGRRIGHRTLAPGTYRATLTPTDAHGVRGASRRVVFKIRKR